MNEEY